MIEASLFICISSMLEFSQFDDASEHKLQYTLACIAIVVLIILFVMIPIFYFKYRSGNTIKSKYFSELFESTKDKAFCKLYIFIFIGRRYAKALVLV